MAEKFISYTKHGVVEASSLVATHGGAHIYNGYSKTADIDNGSVVKLGKFVADDYFEVEVPKETDAVLLVASEPKIYAEYTKMMQEESNFYNGKGEIMQLDDLYKLDRFTLSAEAFESGATLEVGQYVGVTGTGYKLNSLGTTAPTGRGFVGYIYAVASNGRFRVMVMKNQTVEA